MTPDRSHRGGGAALPSILLGGGVLLWPAILNGYPLLFSDTGAFMAQMHWPLMVWDKPYAYGPVLVPVSLWLTLWLPALMQAGLMSWVIWRVLALPRPASLGWHLGICATLAMASAAPWFACLLMPDIFAPVTVLLLVLLAGQDPAPRWPVVLLAAFAIATHLTHLVIAGACIAVVLLLRPRRILRVASPVCLAVAWLFATNIIGHGRLGIAPFGSVFALARLVADGPAHDYLADVCPAAGYGMCAWVGRMPASSDAFLWDPAGPVWSLPDGPKSLAGEASRIVWGTLRAYPGASLRAALGNTAEQLITVRMGEMLESAWLKEAVGPAIATAFPHAELARFQAARQVQGTLPALTGGYHALHAWALAVGALATLAVLAWGVWWRTRTLNLLAACCIAGVIANAFATGALSGPHDRYGARIAWLMLLVPLVALAWRGARQDAERGG